MKNDFSINNLFKGLEIASKRLYKYIEEKETESVFFSLAETIFWINTILDRLLLKDIEEWQDEVNAMRCAFNFIKHNKNILKINTTVGGKSYPLTYPYSYGFKYVFADLANIECEKGKELVKYYQEHLKEKDIKPTIERYISKLSKS